MNYKIKVFYYGIISCMLLGVINYTYALNKKDEIFIKKTINEYVIGWNQSDANKFSEAFSSDADFINIFGQKFKGRSEIRDRHDLIFKTFLKNSKFKVVALDLKEIKSNNVVIVHVNWHVTVPKEASLSQNNQSQDLDGIFTHVLTKESGKWLIIASQNTLEKKLPK